MEFCQDCQLITEGETIVNLLTPDPNAYEDGEYILICPFCGNDAIINLQDERDD